jgi:hypothetical protein
VLLIENLPISYVNELVFVGYIRTTGSGKYVYANGTYYDGQFHLGEYDGRGTCMYSDGDAYVGSWKKGINKFYFFIYILW